MAQATENQNYFWTDSIYLIKEQKNAREHEVECYDRSYLEAVTSGKDEPATQWR